MANADLEFMMSGSGLPKKVLGRVERAAGAFSNGQLKRMRRASIRIWNDNSVPTLWKEVAELGTTGGAASYQPNIRTVHVRVTSTTDQIRHELAHAWDHYLGGALSSLEKAKRKELERAIQRKIRLWSASDTKRAIVMYRGGVGVRKRMTVRQMYMLYKERPITRERRFGNPSTRVGYSTRSVREFFAEAYSVFFGSSRVGMARMLAFAPEVFALMEWLAGLYGLSKPDREALAKVTF